MKPDSDKVPDFNLPEPRQDIGLSQGVQNQIIPGVPAQSRPVNGLDTVSLAPGGSGTKLTEIEEDNLTERTIETAKKIISDYSKDPYLQAIELWRLRTAYMRQGFGHTVKLAEDV